MRPTRPSPADDMRLLDRLRNKIGARYDGRNAHRMVLTPEDAHGPLAIMGAIGLFFANTFGAFGVVSAGRNWGSPAVAVHRWEISMF